MTRLRIRPNQPGQWVEVLDGNRRPVEAERDEEYVAATVAPGVYAVRFYQGTEFGEQLVVAKPGMRELDVYPLGAGEPRFSTAAPVDGTLTSHEWQRDPAMEQSRLPAIGANGSKDSASLFIFLRCWRKGVVPRLELTIHDFEGRKIADLQKDGRQDRQRSWIALHIATGVQALRLRFVTADGLIEQAVFVCAGWQTQVFLLEQPGEVPAIQYTSILMAPAGQGFDGFSQHILYTEAALRALALRSSIDADLSWTMFREKFQNPMLGLYAALLHFRRRKPDLGLMKEVIGNLRAMMGDIPDVTCLQLALDAATGERPQKRRRLEFPTMLAESWQRMIAASQEQSIAMSPVVRSVNGNAFMGSAWLYWRRESVLPAKFRAAAAKSSIMPGASEGRAEVACIDAMEMVRAERRMMPDAPISRIAWLSISKATRITIRRKLAGFHRDVPLSEKLRLFLTAEPQVTERIRTLAGGVAHLDFEARLLRQLSLRFSPAYAKILQDDSHFEFGQTSPEELARSLPYKLAATGEEVGRAVDTILESLVVPSARAVSQFITAYAGSPLGRDLLRAFSQLPTGPLVRATGKVLNALQFLFLYYEPEQAERRLFGHRDAPEWSWPEYEFLGGPGWPEETCERLRREAVVAIRNQVENHVLMVPLGWETRVFPPRREQHAQVILPPLEFYHRTEPPSASLGAS